jgi:hypothetical protein
VKISSKNIFLSILLVSLFAALQGIAMEMEPKKNDSIEGRLFIVGNAVYARGAFSETLQSQLRVKENDMAVEVWATSNESKNWATYGHPSLEEDQDFPTHLPYEKLKGLKENTTLNLTLYGKNFALRAAQLEYCNNRGTFEKVLEAEKREFVDNPNCLASEKLSLLEKGILNINGGKYSHGIFMGLDE